MEIHTGKCLCGKVTFKVSGDPVFQGNCHCIKNGKPDGHGEYTSQNGSMFEGEYSDGKRNGQGKYINYEGIIWVGEFREGNLWNVTRYDKDGNIKWKIVNGVKQ